MIEILFRAISIHGGRVYGYYAYTSRFSNNNYDYKHIIITKKGEIKEIGPETLGQYTGLTDKNGVKIFEGDVVKYDLYGDGYIQTSVIPEMTLENRHFFGELQSLVDDKYYIEIIGNIHQHPHLIP